jgi:uncharacterized protein (TIGR00369 family)
MQSGPLVRFEIGQAETEVEAGPQRHNRIAITHGRTLSDLTDATVRVSKVSSLTAGKTFSSLDLQMNYLRPIQDGELTARTRTVWGSNHRLSGVGGVGR